MVGGDIVVKRELLVLGRGGAGLARGLGDVRVALHGSTGPLGLLSVRDCVEVRADCIRVKPSRGLPVG